MDKKKFENIMFRITKLEIASKRTGLSAYEICLALGYCRIIIHMLDSEKNAEGIKNTIGDIESYFLALLKNNSGLDLG